MVGDYQTAVWKYNMPEHIHESHPGYAASEFEDGAPLPPSLAHAMHISAEEEKLMGIPEQLIPLKSDLPLLPESGEQQKARGRKRAITSTQTPAAKRTKD